VDNCFGSPVKAQPCAAVELEMQGDGHERASSQ